MNSLEKHPDLAVSISRRKFGIITGGAVLLLLSPPVEAKRGKCRERKGYQLFDSDSYRPEHLNLVGQKVPSFYQLDKNPKSTTFKKYVGPQNYEGKVIVLNFWADWCKPCIEELPLFQSVHERYNDVIVLAQEAGSYGYPKVDLSAFTFPVLGEKGKSPQNFRICERNEGLFDEYFDYPKGRINKFMGGFNSEYFYGVSNLPTTFIVDKTGIIRERKQNKFRDKAELDSIVLKYR